MDFNTLGSGSPFYVLTTSGKPTLKIGTVQTKTVPQQKFVNSTNALNGTSYQTVINITARFNGVDEVFTDVPINVEVAKNGSDIFTGSQTAMSAVVENLIQTSKKALEEVENHKTMIAEGDKILEVLNPKYAEDKKQAKTISDLEKGYAEMAKKFAKLESDNAQILAEVRKLTGTQKSAKP